MAEQDKSTSKIEFAYDDLPDGRGRLTLLFEGDNRQTIEELFGGKDVDVGHSVATMFGQLIVQAKQRKGDRNAGCGEYSIGNAGSKVDQATGNATNSNATNDGGAER